MRRALFVKKITPRLLLVGAILSLGTACTPATAVNIPPTPTAFITATFSPTSTATLTQTPTLSPTRKPLVLVFYGDSVLKVGDVNQAPSEGFSFVDNLRSSLPPADQIIVSNHGGRRARWAFENLDEYVLHFQPDVVTLWWGMNDLGGCPGVFNRETDALMQPQLTTLINEHIYYLRMQIESILDKGGTVFVMTPIPILGALPWSHLTSDYQLVWETDHYCDFNPVLQKLVDAQKSLVSGYSSAKKPVYLVDAWQVYQDNPNAGKMYMDVVHPASHGVELIAAEWLRVFRTIDDRSLPLFTTTP